MKKALFLILAAACALPAVGYGQERAAGDKRAVEEAELPAYFPLARYLANMLSVPLYFSARQQERVEKLLSSDTDRPMQLTIDEYKKTAQQARLTHINLSNANYELYKLNNNVFDSVRPMLTLAQQDALDQLIYSGYFNFRQPSSSIKSQPVVPEPAPQKPAPKQKSVSPAPAEPASQDAPVGYYP